MKTIDVTAAIIASPQNNILFAQRKESDPRLPLLWEFPGGKIEPGEAPEDCLVREIQEEFELDVEIEKFFVENLHQYEFANINLISYLCRSQSEKINIKDHESAQWLAKKKAQNLNFAPADIPIYKKLLITNWP